MTRLRSSPTDVDNLENRARLWTLRSAQSHTTGVNCSAVELRSSPGSTGGHSAGGICGPCPVRPYPDRLGSRLELPLLAARPARA